MSKVTVGTLLARIATTLNDGLRLMSFADKRQWGPDEHEQLRLLEETLDEAKKDFQELAPLVNGQFYYENDRKREWRFFFFFCLSSSPMDELEPLPPPMAGFHITHRIPSYPMLYFRHHPAPLSHSYFCITTLTT
jgi:hypothetical protein